jgi:mRNA deadenylase 3'-5' endonuclease subunit Ccr4
MKIMSYLCLAKRQVRAKAYASSLDEKLNAPSRGIQFCQTSKPGTLHVQLS